MTDIGTQPPVGDLVYLAGCAVNRIAPDPARIEAMDLERVRLLASRHRLEAAVAVALNAAGIRARWIDNALAGAMRRAAMLNGAYLRLRSELDGAGIWYMPLKGTVLKDYYPQDSMREMADCDVLIDPERAADVRSIMERNGFSTESFGKGSHDVYHKPPVLNFEIHRSLFGTEHDPLLYAYYRDVKARLIKKEGWEYRFSPEDFFLYMLAHEYKHFSGSGTGLRSLLDTYVFLRKFGDTLDTGYIAAEAGKMGIADFERKNRELALCLFGGGTPDEEQQKMLAYMASSGVYGTIGHRVDNGVKKLGGGSRGKRRYVLQRLFLPMESVRASYPFFYRHKFLLPGLVVYRLGRAAINWPRIGKELRSLRKKSEQR